MDSKILFLALDRLRARMIIHYLQLPGLTCDKIKTHAEKDAG